MMQNEALILPRSRVQRDPLSVEDYIDRLGFFALRKALTLTDGEILDEMLNANLNGRGGASYLAGRKWNQLYNIHGEPKYIVCNADEGEPGTFKDRDILRYDPIGVIDGMLIASWLFKAKRGFLYIRGEYIELQAHVQKALDNVKAAGYLGKNIMGIEGFEFEITVVSGAGAYICGENSALLNSIEAKAGRPRIKPPHLAEVGLYQCPTLVNNVETFACVPVIFTTGARLFKQVGVENDGGTRVLSLSGHVKNRGVVEVNVGIPLRDILYDSTLGGGMAGDKPLKFIHLGGQSGPIAFPEQLETRCCYNDLKEEYLSIGSGAVVVMDESVCLVDYIRKVTEFFVHESCGKCVPCRVGGMRMLELLTDLTQGRGKPGDIERLETLADQISTLSACGLGQAINKALGSCLRYRREEFEAHTRGECPCGGCHFAGGEKECPKF